MTTLAHVHAHHDGTGTLKLEGQAEVALSTADDLERVLDQLLALVTAEARASGETVDVVAQVEGSPRTGLRVEPSGEITEDPRVLARSLTRSPPAATRTGGRRAKRSRMVLRTPRAKKAKVARRTARVAAAAGKFVSPVNRRLSAAGHPSATMLGPAEQVITTTNQGERLTGTVRLAGVASGAGPLPATTTLYGPFGSSSAAHSARPSGERAIATTTFTVADTNGEHPIPRPMVVTEGWYAVRVQIEGNDLNRATKACRAVYKVVRQINLQAYPQPGVIHRDADNPNAQLVFDVSNLPLGYDTAATVYFFGHPDEKAPSCTINNVIWGGSVRVNADGRYTTPVISIAPEHAGNRAFQWAVILPGHEFAPALVTGCGDIPVART